MDKAATAIGARRQVRAQLSCTVAANFLAELSTPSDLGVDSPRPVSAFTGQFVLIPSVASRQCARDDRPFALPSRQQERSPLLIFISRRNDEADDCK
jgi:hypothetical protein